MLTLVLSALLAACSSSPAPLPEAPAPAPAAPPVGEVRLLTRTPSADAPALGVVVFDQGLGNPVAGEPVFPTIRKAESLLLPVTLADTLRDSGAFSVVRVVHDPGSDQQLILDGEILRSDGIVLELAVTLRGADGQLLFARRYRDEATPGDYPVRSGEDPFADLHRAVSNDVVAVVDDLDAARRRELARLALMRFGAQLAPQIFAPYLAREGDVFTLRGYPAADDPMLARLDRVRRQDELFIDTVDQQYRDLRDDVGASYDLWRGYGYELETYGEAWRESAAGRRIDARRGSFAAMQQVYGTYRKVKLQEEDLRSLVRAFGGESLETVITVDDSVFRLSGSVGERYAQWRAILGRIYALEAGEFPEP